MLSEEAGSKSLFSGLRSGQQGAIGAKGNAQCALEEKQPWALLSLQINFPDSPPPPGAEPGVPTFSLPWGVGTGTACPVTPGTSWDSAHPQSPRCRRPCRLCARLRSSRHRQSPPGEESGGEDRPAAVHPVLQTWVPGTVVPRTPRHPKQRGPCTGAEPGRDFHGCHQLRWVPAAATLQVGSLGDTTDGRWVPGWVAGWVSLFPSAAGQGSIWGGKGRRLQGELTHGRLRPAHRVSCTHPGTQGC